MPSVSWATSEYSGFIVTTMAPLPAAKLLAENASRIIANTGVLISDLI